MEAKILRQHGLVYQIAGIDYNFRQATMGDQLQSEYTRLIDQMGIKPKQVYSGKQVHGKHVAYCDGTNGEDYLYGKVFEETDGLITDQAEVALLIKFADCTPVVLYDYQAQVLACVHSGWRSTAQRISKQALDQMIQEFGAQKEHIVAFVGPSIDQDHYQVGSEVYQAFADFPERDHFFKEDGNGRYLMNMLGANLSILHEQGLTDSQIEICQESTFTSSQLHSARREQSGYALNAILTMIPKK